MSTVGAIAVGLGVLFGIGGGLGYHFGNGSVAGLAAGLSLFLLMTIGGIVLIALERMDSRG